MNLHFLKLVKRKKVVIQFVIKVSFDAFFSLAIEIYLRSKNCFSLAKMTVH